MANPDTHFEAHSSYLQQSLPFDRAERVASVRLNRNHQFLSGLRNRSTEWYLVLGEEECVRVLVAQPSNASGALASMLASKLGLEVEGVNSIDAACMAMKSRHFEALLLDLELSEEGCLGLLESIEAHPTMPHVVAIASSGPMEVGFRLAQLGVRAVLHKPIDPCSLALALDGILTQPPNLRRLVRSSVGLIGVRVMEDLIRSEMVAEALARAHGSRRGAASMLRISRQLLQHIMRADGSGRTPRGVAKITR